MMTSPSRKKTGAVVILPLCVQEGVDDLRGKQRS